MNRTMDQHRARWAWEQTAAIQGKDWFGKYAKLVEGAPATILQTGLGQTAAFYLSKTARGDCQKTKKGDRHYCELLVNLASWLCEGGGYENPDQEGNRRGKNGEDLLKEIREGDRDRYRALTDEALEYLIWLKRFGKALARDEEEQTGKGESA